MFLRVKLSRVELSLAACLLTGPQSRWYISEVQDSFLHGGVAQLVEQAAHIRWVRGSNPFAAIFFFMQWTAG
jgi:hypothetical protein